MKRAISHRLTIAASLVLAAFLGIAATALVSLYEQRAMAALQTQLLGHFYTLLSAAGEDNRGLLTLAPEVPDPRLNQTDSGLYAAVASAKADYSWQSASMLGQQLALSQPAEAGEQRYRRLANLLVLDYGLAWEDLDGQAWPYTVSIGIELTHFMADLSAYRRALLGWLGGSALVLLLIQWLVLRWGLRPLKQAAADIRDVEAGRLDNLQGDYPEELQGLTSNLNSLLRHARASQQRYRNSLGDLAHSLKTPLALLQSSVDRPADELRQALNEQLPRIDELVQYQLQRASVAGNTGIAMQVLISPLLDKIVRGMEKIYHDKGIRLHVDVAQQLHFHGDAGDLMELLGNLIDNACKYGRSQVRVTARQADEALSLVVEDDGPGIDAADYQLLLQRGMRADEQQPGQGIGLAVVNEIVTLYQAQLDIGRGELGGARIEVVFPVPG